MGKVGGGGVETTTFRRVVEGTPPLVKPLGGSSEVTPETPRKEKGRGQVSEYGR